MKTINITEKTGKLIAIKNVSDSNDLVIINKSGITIRLRVSDLRVMGRATQGVRLINLEKKNDEIASVCKVDTEPEVEETSEQIELNVENQTEEIVENEETINENNEENNEIGDDNDDSKGSAQGTLNFED